MITVNLTTLLTPPATPDRFNRTIETIVDRVTGTPVSVLRDQVASAGLLFGSLRIMLQRGQVARVMVDDAAVERFQTDQGLFLAYAQGICLFPTPPRIWQADQEGRLTTYQVLRWDVERLDGRVSLTASAPDAGTVEFVWVSAGGASAAHLENLSAPHPLESQTWAVEGCWSPICGPGAFWDFWIAGSIYNRRVGAFGRFQSAQTAYSLYKIAAVLCRATGKRFYEALMEALAYAALAGLRADGAWTNGEWCAEPEVHLRFQIDGVHLLLDAYRHFGDPALLVGAEHAAQFVVGMRDELQDGAWWFLHDTLELDQATLRARFPQTFWHRAFGKQPANTLTLNTHIAALTMFQHMRRATDRAIYEEAWTRGMAALELVLARQPIALAQRVAEHVLMLSFENRRASWPRRGLRHLARTRLVHRLTWVQRFWPCFVTPGGYIWRDLTLPLWGYWYHLVNLYDLISLYLVEPRPWMRGLIDRGVDYTLRSNLVPYLCARHHPIVPQWLQILKAYAAIEPEGGPDLLARELRRVCTYGYGLPPELYSEPGSFLPAEARIDAAGATMVQPALPIA